MKSKSSPLDFFSKLGDPRIARRVEQIRSGGAPSGPAVVDLDPTAFCDLACPGCISANVLSSGRFTESRLYSIANELTELGVLGVVLIGGGEPLIHPSVGKLIRALYGSGIQVGMVTNGTMISRHIEVLSECLSWTRVSWDAGTEEGFQRVRPSRSGRSQFTKVLENTRLLASRSTGIVGVSFMVTSESNVGQNFSNISEIYEAANRARDVGADYFELKLMLNDDHTVAEYSSAEIEQIRDGMRLCSTLEDETFSFFPTENATSLVDSGQVIQVKEYRSCSVRLLRTTITPTGVYPCAYHRGVENLSYGDPAIHTIRELWENVVAASPDPSIDCRFHCARHGLNEALGSDSKVPITLSVRPNSDIFI